MNLYDEPAGQRKCSRRYREASFCFMASPIVAVAEDFDDLYCSISLRSIYRTAARELRPMRRVSELILIIFKSYSLPGSSVPALFSGPVDGRKLPAPSSRL